MEIDSFQYGNLVGGTYPSEKYEFVSGDDYSQYMEKKHVPNHQTVISYNVVPPSYVCWFITPSTSSI